MYVNKYLYNRLYFLSRAKPRRVLQAAPAVNGGAFFAVYSCVSENNLK